MPFDLSIARLYPSRRAGAAAMAALAASIAFSAPPQAAAPASGSPPPIDIDALVGRDAPGGNPGFLYEAHSWDTAERLTLAGQRAGRAAMNQDWTEAVNAAFHRPGVGTCFRGQADGLVSGRGADARGMTREGRELAERSSVQVVVRYFRGGEVTHIEVGTGTVVRARDGGPNRVLTAAHVANAESFFFLPENTPGREDILSRRAELMGGEKTIEVWGNAPGGWSLLGSAEVSASGGGAWEVHAEDGVEPRDWAVLSVSPWSKRAADFLRSVGLDVATDLSPTPFAARMGTPYGRDGSGGDLPPSEAMPGRVATQGIIPGHSGGAFLLADADGVPRIHGVVSTAIVDPEAGDAFLEEFLYDNPALASVATPTPAIRGDVVQAARANYSGIVHLPESALEALGVAGTAVHTPNARVLAGAQGFVAGYGQGRCLVSAGVTAGFESLSPADSPRDLAAFGRRTGVADPSAPLHVAGSTWVPGESGGFVARVEPGRGPVPIRTTERPAAPDPAEVFSKFGMHGSEASHALSGHVPPLGGYLRGARSAAFESWPLLPLPAR